MRTFARRRDDHSVLKPGHYYGVDANREFLRIARQTELPGA